MRGREFIMKDAYSFHATQADLEKFYLVMREAYVRVFQRCGLDARVVVGHSGAIGGTVAHELMVLANNGESEILSCPNTACAYTATNETADGTVPDVASTAQPAPIEKVATPDTETIEAVATFLKVPETQCVKALLYRCDDALAVVFVRGDREVNPAKLHRYIQASEIEIAEAPFLAKKKACGVVAGYCGPMGIKPDHLLFDTTVKAVVNGVVGANEAGFHCRNFNLDRDMPGAQVCNVVVQKAGDACPKCGTAMTTLRGIEVGNIFQLGTRYSEAMKASFLDADNVEKPFIMGCYGIGVTRTVAAAIEQYHDANGIIWPRAIAPYDVLVQLLDLRHEEVRRVADTLVPQLAEMGLDVLVDDRDAKPGFKFKDADLVGIPLRVTLSPRALGDGKIELKRRVDKEATLVPVEGAAAKIQEIYQSCP
jgi:prolyl-tRNA synthetase